MTPKENIMINGGLMTEYKYTVFYEPLEEGGYNVLVPAMPEICTFGQSLKEARAMAEDAIRCVIESNTELGEPIPQDFNKDPIKEQIAISVAA